MFLPGPLYYRRWHLRQLLCLATGASALAMGIARLINPPKEPDYSRGYRSTLAMRNQATWVMAQRESAAALIVAGTTGMIVSWTFCALIEGNPAIIASLAVSAALAGLTVAWTEKRLLAAFDTNGCRKTAGGTKDEKA